MKKVSGISIHVLVVFFMVFMVFPCKGNTQDVGDKAQKDTNNVFTLGEVEVRGKKEEIKNVTVDKITSEEMRVFNADNVAEAANLILGVNLSKVGARNEQTVFVRGFDIKHAPIFLDGVPIYVPYDGYPDLARFTTNSLSEILVSKGFTSVLYGPNTMGGAINIVTLRPEKVFEGDMGADYSTGDTYKAHINLGSRQNKWYVQAGGSYVDSGYFRVSDDFKPTATEDGGQRENSYHKDESGNLKIGYTPGGDDEYAVSYMNEHGKKGVPPYTGTDSTQMVRYWQWPYWNVQSTHFTSKTGIANTSYVKTTAFYDKYNNSLVSYDDSTYSTITKKYAFRSWYNDYTYGGSIEAGTEALKANLLKLALHYKNDVHREHNQGNPIQTFEDRNISAGLEDTITFTKKMYAIAGISYDMVDTLQAQDLNSSKQIVDFETGSTSGINPQFGLFYTLPDKGVVHAAISRNTRIPSIKDKFSYRLGTAIPNPDLDPEKSINYEMGYQKTLFSRLLLKTTVFHNNITDYILQITVPDPSDATKTKLQNQNIGKVSQYGAEAELSGAVLDSLETGLGYTYINQNNRTDSNKLTGVPTNKADAYLKYSPIKTLSGLLAMQYASKNYSSSNGVRVAGAYTVVNAKIMFEPIQHLSAEAGIDNLFDKNYVLEEGYPEPGRGYFVNVGYRF